MNSKIYLFPDTNLFIQCKPLHELDWAGWKEYDEVCLIVSRPIQAEIDKQKGGGNSRLSKRARLTSSIFREILLSDKKYREVRSSKPIVRLYLRQDIKVDESLSDQLIYSERDDQLVGVVSSFCKLNNENQAFILTHDTGPMTSADMVGVKFIPIPDEWLLAPESSESDKQIAKLQTELSRLKKTEPDISVHFENKTEDGIELNQLKRCIFSPLTTEEISNLIKKITVNIPLSTDFGPKEPSDDNELTTNFYHSRIGITREFIVATEEQIKNYKDKEYPSWLESCKDNLSNCHEIFNALFTSPRMTISLCNIGTRPAKDALITLSTKGDFLISPPPYKESDEEHDASHSTSLPLPPTPPKSKWITKDLFNSLRGLNYSNMGLAGGIGRNLDLPSIYSRKNRDPNDFYYQNRPHSPVRSFSLECEQWRHQSGSEYFTVDLHFNNTPGKISGALEIKVQAANMADPYTAQKPIQMNIVEVSVFEQANILVEELITRYRISH
ncbi:hypothetical protein ACH4P7_001908 [Enterobacter hormaechei]